MKFPHPLLQGELLKRYKRFLADVMLPDGTQITAHTANTGAMTGCSEPGSRVWLSVSDNPKRKYPHSWELVEVAPQVLCGINTMMSNRLVHEAIERGVVAELQGYANIRPEVKYGEENSRIDLLLENDKLTTPCYVEVKNVTLAKNGIGYFPDAVTTRGSKHLRELMAMVAQGKRAVIFFCVQRGDVREVRPADHVDAVYGRTLREALACGVEAMAYGAVVSPEGIALKRCLPVRVSPENFCPD
ncbi:MAG: DNA/RNA nuclease SfsA [Gammaproteobacteria bacterium]|nr:DNA/RNA nuclease SfsA [Gammaproteobacteria bacterium]